MYGTEDWKSQHQRQESRTDNFPENNWLNIVQVTYLINKPDEQARGQQPQQPTAC